MLHFSIGNFIVLFKHLPNSIKVFFLGYPLINIIVNYVHLIRSPLSTAKQAPGD